MGTRGRTCPTCAQQWRQRDASFCGSCGALLDPAAQTAEHRRRDMTMLAFRLVAVVAAVGLVVAAAATNLTPRSPDAGVRIDAGARTSPTPLTDTEATALRLRSDPDRLRCEPQGCELWRHHRPDVSAASGAVELASGAIALVVAGPDTAVDSTSDRHPAGASQRLIALDPASGDERWSRSLADLDTVGPGDGWVSLAASADGGLLVLTRSSVVAVDASGERRWIWHDAPGHAAGRITGAFATPEVVLVTRESRHGPFTRQRLTGLDPVTARTLWTEDVRQVAALDADLAVVVDGGRIRALDHASGATLWDAPAPDGRGTRVRREGVWVGAQHPRVLALLDPASGREVGRVDGWLTASLVPTGDRWLGTMRAPGSALEPSWLRVATGPMDVVALEADGSLGWRTHLGTIRPWRECCPLEFDGTTGEVTVVDPVRVHWYDAASGELTDVRVTAREGAAASRNPGLSQTESWRPHPDVELARHPEDGRVRVRTPVGHVLIRSGRTIDIASLEPLVVVDENWVMGARPIADR